MVNHLSMLNACRIAAESSTIRYQKKTQTTNPFCWWTQKISEVSQLQQVCNPWTEKKQIAAGAKMLRKKSTQASNKIGVQKKDPFCDLQRRVPQKIAIQTFCRDEGSRS